MRYFLDTEFIESGPERPIHLLSIGMVSENGGELIAVNANAPLHEACDWVWQNVIPHLDHTYDMPLPAIRAEILRFVGHDPRPEFWAYFADYDWVVFCQIFGTMLDLPSEWPKYCMDLKQWATMLGNPQLPKQVGQEHDALEDARDVRRRWHYLYEYERKYGFPKRDSRLSSRDL